MATRWYFTKTAHTTINPGTLGSWNNTGQKQIMSFNTTKGTDSTYTTYTTTGLTSVNTTLLRQYITPGMAAGIVFDTTTQWTCTIRCSESTSTANCYLRMHVAIVSEDGLTQRGYSFTTTDGSEFTTTLAGCQISTSNHGPTYTSVAGDRIVVEIGWSKTTTSSPSVSTSISLGNADPTTDLSGVGDTDLDNPWFETTATTGTGTGGGTPPSTVEDFGVAGYITGVLDEWT